MTTRFLRQIAVVATAGALAVSSIALPAAARPKAERGPKVEHSQRHEAKQQSKAAKSKQRGKSAAAKARKEAAKARKAARFQANGTLIGVLGDTIVVGVKGGSAKSLRGQIATFDVSDARIHRDDAPATVADLVTGDHVAVKGMKVDGVLVAARVNADSPDPVVEEPTEDVTEDPSDEVTEDPTEDLTEDPSDDVTEDPTEEVTEDSTEGTDEVVTEEPSETVEPVTP